MSDHLAILFYINVKAARSFLAPHKVFDYKRADFEGLKKTMSDSAENFFASSPQNFAVEDNWSLFKTTLTEAMVNYIPQRRSCMKYELPWITSEIERQMRTGWSLRYNGTLIVSRLVKESRSDYLNNVIGASLQENRPKKFWSYVRSCKSEVIGIPPLRYGNNLFSADKSNAEALNSYFFLSIYNRSLLNLPLRTAQFLTLTFQLMGYINNFFK